MEARNLDFAGAYLETMAELRGAPELFPTRREVITETGEAGTIPLDSVLEPRIKLIAALSLAEEGYIHLDPREEGSLRLTEKGMHRFEGIKALSRG